MNGAAEELTIAELARRAGVTPRTIRYYVAEGLLPPPRGGGQRRLYARGHLVRLFAIKRLKEAFLPLAEIRRRLASLSDGEIERLAQGGSPLAAGERREYLAAFAPPPVWSNPAATPLSGPLAFQAGAVTRPPGPTRDDLLRSSPLGTPGAGRDAPDGDDAAWYRVTLAPGVELHYQRSGDRRREEAIAHLIRAAISMLSQT